MVFTKRYPSVGAVPGTLVIAEDAPPPRIHVIVYTPESVREHDISDVEQLQGLISEDAVMWVDVQGFGDEQVSIVLGKGYVLTFQERYGDVLDPVRRRIHEGKGLTLRGQGADYLAYAIQDTIIDGYYPVLEILGDQLADLEDKIMTQPGPRLLRKLNRTKNMLSDLRRSLWPQRESVNSLIRDEHPLVTDVTRMYLRDTYDHCIQTTEVIEMYREMAGGLMNTYLSSMANRTNDVMRVLTVMASIFIPLTFLAGIYGMNFDYMPELHFWWFYPLMWLAMLLLGGTMVLYFYRKGWMSASTNGLPDDEDPED